MNSAKFSFPKRSRLLTASDYRYVFSKPTRFSDVFFSFFYRKNCLAYPRLGFAIAKKHVKSSVKRNRAKRIIREHFRLKHRQISNFDIVVLASQNVASANKKELLNSVNKCWNKLTQNKYT